MKVDEQIVPKKIIKSGMFSLEFKVSLESFTINKGVAKCFYYSVMFSI